MSETQQTEETGKEEPKVQAEEVKATEEVEPEKEASDSEDNVEELKKEEAPQEENFKEKFYYLAAEMENMRKRNERERENLLKFGSEKILKGLLEVVDNLERTTQAISTDEDEKVKNIYTGIEMVSNQFLDVLKQNGLEPVKTVGEQFDPNFHEAMSQQAQEGKDDNEIIMEYQKGYVLNGRLLRAAKVVVVKN